MSTDGFENTFVCVHAHLDLIRYLAASLSAVQKEGVHLKGSVVLVWGLGQRKRVILCYFFADGSCKLQGWGLSVSIVLYGKKKKAAFSR